MSKLLFASLLVGLTYTLCSTAVGDDKQSDTGLATINDGIKQTQRTAPSVGDIGPIGARRIPIAPQNSPRISPPNSSLNENSDSEFADKKQQRQYEKVLKSLRSLKPSSGGEASKDDWFVVGGVVGNQANFDAFQGEESVARRVVEFVAQTNNRCQWKVYSREQDSYVAEEMVGKVKTDYEQWKQIKINRMVAMRRAQQRAVNAQRQRAASMYRSASYGQTSRRSGGC